MQRRNKRLDVRAYWVRIIEILFALVWLSNFLMKLQPGAAQQIPGILAAASQGQPAFLSPWFSFWISFVSTHATSAIYWLMFVEFALFFMLALGFARRVAYWGGIAHSFLVWGIADGFGSSTTQLAVGPGFLYIFVFLLLIWVNRNVGIAGFSLDSWIKKRFAWWRHVA